MVDRGIDVVGGDGDGGGVEGADDKADRSRTAVVGGIAVEDGSVGVGAQGVAAGDGVGAVGVGGSGVDRDPRA